MIIGVTHDPDGRVVQRLSVSTKVSIGLPPNGDCNHPTKLDHFVFLRKKKSANRVEWEADPELTRHYGEQCRELHIMLIDDDIENVFLREEATYFDRKEKRKKTSPIWALSLEVEGDDMQKLIANLTENARLFAETRKLLGSGGKVLEVVEDEQEQAPEVAAEFYPATAGCLQFTTIPRIDESLNVLRRLLLHVSEPVETPEVGGPAGEQTLASANSFTPSKRRDVCVSTGLKSSHFQRFGWSHSTEKFALGHTEPSAGSASEILPRFKFGRSRPTINANRYPPAPSVRRATMKSKVILRSAETA